jgi:DNA-binding XRE family transcriptional regulator
MRGLYTPEQHIKEREKLAHEVLDFRRRYLLSQIRMAEVMKVSRRTVQMIEAGQVLPHMVTRRKFLDLKIEFAKKFRAA